MASKRNNQLNGKDSVPALKQRIKELEAQVLDYKKRLDELRKAKLTTITKREREVINITGPNLGHRRDSTVPSEQNSDTENRPNTENSTRIKELERELNLMRLKHDALLESTNKHMQRQILESSCDHEAELSSLRLRVEELEGEKSARAEPNCNHEAELSALRLRVEELEGDKVALEVQNSDLSEQCGSLLHDLSQKEAEWCDMEEKLHQKLKQSWGEKYAEWMQQMESRLLELQRHNAILNSLVNAQRPTGPDPTGQDPS